MSFSILKLQLFLRKTFQMHGFPFSYYIFFYHLCNKLYSHKVGTKLPTPVGNTPLPLLSTHSERREGIYFLVSMATPWPCSQEGSKQNENGGASYCPIQKECQGQVMQGKP